MRKESNRVSCSSRDGNGQEVVMVAAVLWSRKLRIRRKSQYDGGHICGSDRS